MGGSGGGVGGVEEWCGGCDLAGWEVLARFHGEVPGNTANALHFLRQHGVLPRGVRCPRCRAACHLRRDSPRWYCASYTLDRDRRKRIRCNFSVSDYKGTFFERAHVEPWKVVLFAHHWLGRRWDHGQVLANLKFSTETSVQWRKNCSLVTRWWADRQAALGGAGTVVEIDRELLCRKRDQDGGSGGGVGGQVWVFGGIERDTKRTFLVPLSGGEEEDVTPLVCRHILPGSVVVCGAWGAALPLHTLGYTLIITQDEEDSNSDSDTNTQNSPAAKKAKEEHTSPTNKTHTRTHTRSLTKRHDTPTATPTPAATPATPAHTHTIRALWGEVQQWVRRPGMRAEYFQEYLSRFLFIHHHKDQHLHHFFTQTALLFPPPHADLTH